MCDYHDKQSITKTMNIKSKRKAREQEKENKRGYPLKTGFGEEHGSKKRRGPKDYSRVVKGVNRGA